MRLGVVTGLAREADCLTSEVATDVLEVACAGADPRRAAWLAEGLIRDGCRALVSFGVAGGLDFRLKPGDLLLADVVVTADGQKVRTDEKWRRRLAERCGALSVQVAPLLGSDVPVLRPSDKACLCRRTGAWCVDMESHMVARVADDAGVPFVAVRAVADTARRTMPGWLAQAVDETGRPRTVVAAREVLRRPWQLPGLIRLGRDFDAAIATLRRVAVHTRPAFLVLAE